MIATRIAVFLGIILVTFPFGFYRAFTRKFSLRWFLAVHVPVPLIFLMRWEAHISWAFIPFSVLAFSAGQLGGARAGRWYIRRRALAHR